MKHVLVVQLARMGDLLQSKRLILSVLAEADTTVHLLVDNALGAFARQIYPGCVVHTIEAGAASAATAQAVLNSGTAAERQMQSSRQALHDLLSVRMDMVYFLNSSPLSTALARFFEPEICRGHWVYKGQPGHSLWCRLAKRFTGHRPSSPFNLVDYWAWFHPAPVAPSQVNPVARKAGSRRIGVVLSGQQARRSLPAEILAQCLQSIFQAKDGPTFVLLGSHAERKAAHALIRLVPAAVLKHIEDLTGQTALQDLPGQFAEFDALITPDTGLMHLAAHCGVPVQAFFLSSAWCFETGPYGLGHTVWQTMFPCSPCLETASCPHQVQCLSPFGDKRFLAHLRGKFVEDWPDGLCGFVSGFDGLGALYSRVDGEDAHASARAQKRAIAGELLQGQLASLPSEAGELVFSERDWLLPETYWSI